VAHSVFWRRSAVVETAGFGLGHRYVHRMLVEVLDRPAKVGQQRRSEICRDPHERLRIIKMPKARAASHEAARVLRANRLRYPRGPGKS
jgi:hypothetical protein